MTVLSELKEGLLRRISHLLQGGATTPEADTVQDPLLSGAASDDEDRDDVLGAEVHPPHDPHDVAYWVFLLLGAAMLIPWNVFITASEFFLLKFQGSAYQYTFQNYFSVAHTGCNVIALSIALWRQRYANTRMRVIVSMILNILIFLIVVIFIPLTASSSSDISPSLPTKSTTTTILPDIDPTAAYVPSTDVLAVNPTEYFWLILILVAFTGLTTSFFQVGIMSTASLFPGRYMQGVMSGQGLAGTAVALASIISTLITSTSSTGLDAPSKPSPAEIEKSALIYFLCALVVSIVSVLAYLHLIKRPIYLFYTSGKGNTLAKVRSRPSFEEETDVNTAVEGDDESELDLEEDEAIEPKSGVSVWSVMAHIKWYMIATAICTITTLALFPSITSLIKSVVAHPPSDDGLNATALPRYLQDDIFVGLHFLGWNIGDWIGRLLCTVPFLLVHNWRPLLALSTLRLIYFPLFLGCNIVIGDGAVQKRFPTFVASDFSYALILLTFAIANGYILTLCMMAAPRYLQTPNATVSTKEREIRGSVMSFALVTGLAMGGFLSFTVRSFV